MTDEPAREDARRAGERAGNHDQRVHRAAGGSERFLRRWRDNVAAMAGQQGFIRARMYRSLINDAELRFINTADWGSGEALALARANPAWRASMRRMLDDPELHITPRPGVYQVALDVLPGDTR